MRLRKRSRDQEITIVFAEGDPEEELTLWPGDQVVFQSHDHNTDADVLAVKHEGHRLVIHQLAMWTTTTPANVQRLAQRRDRARRDKIPFT
jgi:hypothetical protein